MREWLNRLPIRPEQRLPLALAGGGLVAAAIVFSCCGGVGLLALRSRVTAASRGELSADARALLVAACSDDHPGVHVIRTAAGHHINGGAHTLCPSDAPEHVWRRWLWAKSDLENAGLIKADASSSRGDFSQEHLSVTPAGRAAAKR